MRAGAFDYLAKPFDHPEVIRVVRAALAERERRRRSHTEEISADNCLRVMMGPSDAVTRIIREVNRVAHSDFSVIIQGETGSGKELVARSIYQLSGRADAPFIPLDCGAIPETLIESELFGYQKGAFTGASTPKAGKFEAAHGGTLFLDEIANLPLGAQAKLLRVLQEQYGACTSAWFGLPVQPSGLNATPKTGLACRGGWVCVGSRRNPQITRRRVPSQVDAPGPRPAPTARQGGSGGRRHRSACTGGARK